MTQAAVNEAFSQYPVTVTLKGQDYTIRPMTESDGAAALAFAQGLPEHDILYMRRDITKQSGIDMWLEDIRLGKIFSLLAEDQDGVAGYSTINLTDLEWTSHVADLRVGIATRGRGKGLGRLLAREAFNLALALGVEKVFARMTPDQEGARVLFRELGFQPEALLKDHIKDRNGAYHDLLIKACSVQAFMARREAYGVGS